jgi:PhnB protein
VFNMSVARSVGIVALMRQSEALPTAGTVRGANDPVLHARLEISGSVLIGNDVPAERFEPVRSAYVYLDVDSVAEAERIYEALTRNGEIYMPLQETFFALRFSQLRDQFGTLWSLIFPRS